MGKTPTELMEAAYWSAKAGNPHWNISEHVAFAAGWKAHAALEASRPLTPSVALSREVRDLLADTCRCGHPRSEHGYLYPDGPCGAVPDGCAAYTSKDTAEMGDAGGHGGAEGPWEYRGGAGVPVERRRLAGDWEPVPSKGTPETDRRLPCAERGHHGCELVAGDVVRHHPKPSPARKDS